MRDPRLTPFRAPLAAFGLFVALQAVSGAVLFAGKLGLRPERLVAYYRGAEGSLQAPRTLTGLLEVAVPHLVALPLVLFVTLHLVGFTGLVRRRPLALVAGLGFASAMAGVLAAFGIRWIWPGLAWLKLGAFVGLEASLLVWLLVLLWLFLPPRASRGAAAATGDIRVLAARAAAASPSRSTPAPDSGR
jgi:hypothetical protein